MDDAADAPAAAPGEGLEDVATLAIGSSAWKVALDKGVPAVVVIKTVRCGAEQTHMTTCRRPPPPPQPRLTAARCPLLPSSLPSP